MTALMLVLLSLIFIFLILKVALLSFELPMRRSPGEGAHYRRDSLSGTGGPCDWNDRTSIPIADLRLDDLREGANMLDSRVKADG